MVAIERKKNVHQIKIPLPGLDVVNVNSLTHIIIGSEGARPVRELILNTIIKLREHLDEIRTGKGKKKIRKEIWKDCSNIVDDSLSGDGGERLWVGGHG